MSDQGEVKWEYYQPEEPEQEDDLRFHRRKTDEQNIKVLHRRITDCELSIKQLETDHGLIKDRLDSLCKAMNRVATILETWNNLEGFWKTVNWIAKAVKILMIGFAFVAAVFTAVKTGNWIGIWK